GGRGGGPAGQARERPWKLFPAGQRTRGRGWRKDVSAPAASGRTPRASSARDRAGRHREKTPGEIFIGRSCERASRWLRPALRRMSSETVIYRCADAPFLSAPTPAKGRLNREPPPWPGRGLQGPTAALGTRRSGWVPSR